MMNIMQRVMRAGLCLLYLVFLRFSETSLPASGAVQQVCLPTVSGQLTTPPEQVGTVLINEVVLSSKKPWSCPGSTSVPGPEDTSWIELYNPMALPFNLYIVHAAVDGGPGTNAMYFPFGSAIAAHGFLIIFPNKSIIFPNSAPETFTRRLLFNGNVINQVTIPANLGNGQSYARIPDGASKWKITNAPTIGSSNVLPTATPSVKHTLKSSTTKKKSNTTSSKTGKTTVTTTSTYTGTTITGENTSAPDPPTPSGIQPVWGQMQLPATPSSLPTTSSVATVSPVDTTTSPPPVNNTNDDGPRNILFIGLAIVLIGALFWWGRHRFRRS